MKPIMPILPSKIHKVCFVGNLNIDLIIRNINSFPAWGQEVLGNGYSVVSSGQSAYSAFALRKLNVPVSIIGNVGNDIYGKKILGDLETAGIDITAVETSKEGKTGISIAVVRSDGERAFISDTSCLSEFTYQFVRRHEPKIIESEIVCFVGSFFLPGLPIHDTVGLLQLTKEMGKKTFLDTGWDSANWQKETVSTLRQGLQYLDFFVPNLDEAYAITGQKNPESALKSLLSDGAKVVIIKMGAEGSLTNFENHVEHIPAHKVDVIDAVGAGDVYNAGFLYGVLQEWPIVAGMYFGSVVAALYISKSENRFPSVAMVKEALDNWNLNPFNFEVL